MSVVLLMILNNQSVLSALGPIIKRRMTGSRKIRYFLNGGVIGHWYLENENWPMSLRDCDFATGIWRARNKTDNVHIT